jgi:hypothetical protein
MRFRAIPSIAHSIEGFGNAALVALPHALLRVLRSQLRAGRGCFLERPETREALEYLAHCRIEPPALRPETNVGIGNIVVERAGVYALAAPPDQNAIGS